MGKHLLKGKATITINGNDIELGESEIIITGSEGMTEEQYARSIRDIRIYGQAFIQVPEVPKKPKVEIEYKCQVCGKWLGVFYYHDTCYTIVEKPLGIEDQSDIAEYK